MHFGSPHCTCSSRRFFGSVAALFGEKTGLPSLRAFFLQSRSSPQTLKRTHGQATGYTITPVVGVCVRF